MNEDLLPKPRIQEGHDIAFQDNLTGVVRLYLTFTVAAGRFATIATTMTTASIRKGASSMKTLRLTFPYLVPL